MENKSEFDFLYDELEDLNTSEVSETKEPKEPKEPEVKESEEVEETESTEEQVEEAETSESAVNEEEKAEVEIADAPTFREWMTTRFVREDLQDMVEHGVAAGFDGLIYYKDTAALHDAYEDEMWDMLANDADAGGYHSAIDLIAALADLDTGMELKNWITWYAAEQIAQEITGEEPEEEPEEPEEKPEEPEKEEEPEKKPEEKPEKKKDEED